MQLVTLQPLAVADAGSFQGDDGSPMKRRDGSLVRYVAFEHFGTEQARRVSVHEGFTGELPPPGAVVNVTFELDEKAQARTGARGAYVRYELRLRIVAWAKA